MRRHFNPLAAAVIIVAASALVISYCILYPQYARDTLVIYVCTMVCATLILAISGWIYGKKKTSIDEKEITHVIENLNTEMIIWSENFSYVYINKKLRDLSHRELQHENPRAEYHQKVQFPFYS